MKLPVQIGLEPMELATLASIIINITGIVKGKSDMMRQIILVFLSHHNQHADIFDNEEAAINFLKKCRFME